MRAALIERGLEVIEVSIITLGPYLFAPHTHGVILSVTVLSL
jgi:hypothetical protein